MAETGAGDALNVRMQDFPGFTADWLAFTLIVAGVYAYQVYHVLYLPVDKLQFPPLSDGLIALLGISHAGYLGGKAVDYTPCKN